MRKAFSLIELSIVLVILGLLVGGILAGKSLIRASELRSVSSDLQKFTTATHAFRDKYFYLPGDIDNATSFWGKDAANCNAQPGTATTPGTCNGNGNGQVGWTTETLLYWQHLARAGMVEGTYSGGLISGTLVPGSNVYASRLDRGAFLFRTTNMPYGYGVGHLIMFAGYDSGTSYLDYALLKPEEAWNIDSKLDDGLADSGKLMTYNGYDNGSEACVSSGSFSVKPSSYVLTSTAPDCLIYYRF